MIGFLRTCLLSPSFEGELEGEDNKSVDELFNRKADTPKRRRLRSDMPEPERRLWRVLRRRNLSGFRFRRQYGVGPFVLDFFCPAASLAIELDGDSHFVEGVSGRDHVRQQYIESVGIHVIRFTNLDVMSNLDGVLSVIEGELRRRNKHSPSNSPSNEGEK